METTRPKGRIRFFYSGKGDTIFIESKEADSKPQWALIDCCIPMRTQTHTSVRNFIKKNNIKKLKFVCLTHPDLDHYLGMKKLLRDCFHDIKNDRLEIEEFWDSGVNFMVFSALAERFRDKKRKRHIDELYRYVTKFIITRQIKYCIMNQGYQSISNLGSFYFLALAPTSNLVRRFEQKIVNEILEESDNNRLWAIGEKSNNST